mgnify:CR=1 FL=1
MPIVAAVLLAISHGCTSALVPRPVSLRALPPTHRTSPLHCSEQREVIVSAVLDDEKTTQLFCWISRALSGDTRYNNMMLAFAAVFGDHPDDSPYTRLVQDALAKQPAEDEPVGEPLRLKERERSSLGAMGAAQWTGQFRTRAHALLDVRNLTSVDEWIETLPRGSRRTLAKAAQQNFSVASKRIVGGKPSPHSSLSHFRCVISHEVRLLASSAEEFFDALNQGIGRYIGCTGQAGEIREYRDLDGRVIAFAQEARKGRVIRGQWFYATDEAAKRYVWFHSVQELVTRAIATEGVDTVDLGPSGSDSFSLLKERYGFKSVDDWHAVADYRGPFEYEDGTKGQSWRELDPPDWLFE